MLGSGKWHKITPYLFILPFFVMFTTFKIVPVAYGFLLSFSRVRIAGQPTDWVGLRNYANMFTNPRFYKSLQVTALFTLGQGGLVIGLALGLALLLNIRLKGVSFFRTSYFLPVVLSLAISAMIWRLVLDEKIGFVNIALRQLGFSGYDWLGSPQLVLPSIIVVSTWHWFGFIMIILLAGLQNVPVELYDAAKMDGASPWRIVWHITLPLLFPIIFFVMIITAIGSLQVFEEPLILGSYGLGGGTIGGPSDNVLSLCMYLYVSAFQYFKFGYGGAIACFLIFLIIGVTILQIRLLGRKAGIT